MTLRASEKPYPDLGAPKLVASRCDQCGVEEYMPYACKFCKGKYCASHRLPENHGCQGLGVYRERMRAEGRIVAPEPDLVRPTVARSARAGMTMDAFWSKVDGKMSYVFMGIILAVFVAQQIVIRTAPGLHDDLFPLQNDFWYQPWTIVTSVFSHHPFELNHILFNTLAILFFGTTVERLVGTRRYTWLFVGAGAAAGMAHVLILQLFHIPTGVLGASGAIYGIMGTLVVLAPKLTVLVFFVVPAPLWAMVVLYVVLDFVGIITPGSEVAHFAHLAGLAVGLWYGFKLREKGLRARHERPPTMRRYF